MRTIFVGGFLKCGTSVLASVLCSGKDTNPMIGEVIYLHGIVSNYRTSLELFDLHSRDYFDDREHLRETCAAEVRRFLDMTRARYGDAANLVLKYPQLTPLFPYLHQLLPEAKFVISLRDPRDGVASAVTSKRKGAPEFHNFSLADIAHALTQSYISCVFCCEPSFSERTVYSKYEDLVTDPAAIMGKLSAFTGIEFGDIDPHQAPAEAGWAPDMALQREQATFNELHGRPISAERIGRHRDVLTAAETQEVEQISAQLLDLLKLDHSVFHVATSQIGGDPPQFEISLSEVGAA